MSRREEVLEGLVAFRDDAKKSGMIMLKTGPLIVLLDATIEELNAPVATSCDMLIESLKVALEHESTEARVLLGRLLTELERRTT